MFNKSFASFSVLVFLVIIGFVPLAGQQSQPTTEYIYWTSVNDGIGRASFDGSVYEPYFILSSYPLMNMRVVGLAVSDKYIYWGNVNNNTGTTISRADLDGQNRIEEFITGCIRPLALAVDDKYIYWTNYDVINTIGRATLEGNDVNQYFIPLGGFGLHGIAVDKNYIYWTDCAHWTIGRANLDGSSPNNYWIQSSPTNGIMGPNGVTVTATHIYWTNSNNTIGRANLDGTDPEIWITGQQDLDLTLPFGIAAHGDFIYWSNHFYGHIGRSDLSGIATMHWFETHTNVGYIAFTPDYINVSIDIKPGSYPNTINLTSNGVVPVAILSSDTFDATTVDPITVTLAGAGVRLKGNGTPIASYQDVNKDGRLDIVVQVETSALTLSDTDVIAKLEGRTKSGQRFRGQDTVRIIK